MVRKTLRGFATHRILTGIAIIALAAAGYFGYTSFLSPKPVTVTTQEVKVTKGNLSLAVSATGTIRSPNAADLSFRSSGVVAEVYVQTGASVKKDQPLAKLETRSLELALAQSNITLRTAQLNLQTMLDAAKPEDIASAQATVNAAREKLATMEAQGLPEDVATAEANLANAQAKLDQLRNPLAADIAQARGSVESARVSLINAQTKLDQLQHPTAADLAAARSAVTSASANYERISNPTPADIASAQASVESARSNLLSAQTKLDQLKNPKPEQILSAKNTVATSETNLRNAEDALTNFMSSLNNDEKRRILVEAYVKLYAAREQLALSQSNGSPPDQVAKNEQAVLLALKVVDAAEADTNYPNAGVTAQQYRSAQNNVNNARNNLQIAQLQLQNLLNPSDTDVAAATAAIASAQASVKSAETKLQQLTNPNPNDLQTAESNLKAAEARLAQLTNPTPSDIAAATGSVATAQANAESAQARLNQLLNPTAADLAAVSAAVEQAKSQVAKARTPYKDTDLASQRAALDQTIAQLSKVISPNTDIDIAKAQLSVDRARLDVDQAQFNLDQAVLRAPFDGIISKVSVTPGLSQGIGSSTVVMSILDPLTMQVEANIDESDIGKVELNQNVDLTVDAAGTRPYRGKVTAIAPNATVQSGVTSYLVTMSVTDPKGLKSGMTAVASVVYQQRQNVLLVTNRAIKTAGRDKAVQVMVNGKPETRTIKVGLTDNSSTEVLDGLQEGDLVLVAAGSTAQSGRPGGAGSIGVPGLGGAGFRPGG